MISEDEENQGSQRAESLESDEQVKSQSHEENEEVKDTSQDNMISKNESEQSNLESESQEAIEQDQQVPQKTQAEKFLIRFPKPGKKKEQSGNSASKDLKPKLSLKEVYPWLSEKTLSIENPLIKLHNEIIDYYLALQQEEQTHNYLSFTFNKLQGILFKTFKNCDVLAPFLTNRIYLKNSQVEIFILFDASCWRSPQTVEKVRQCLQKANLQQIRFFEAQPQKGKQQKVGFNCITAQKSYQVQIKLVTQQWISYLSMINDVLENSLEGKYLYLIFDTMVRQRLLNNSVKSYLLFGMIAVFIQERKRQRNRSLTENLLKFLEYFGMGPLDERKIVYIGRGEFDITLDPSLHGNIPQFSFWINPTIDISNHNVKQFFGLLKNRYRLISNYNFSNSESILWSLINPAQEQFRY